jgi:hypothetical protein
MHLRVTGIVVGPRVVAHDRSLRRLVAVTTVSFAAFGLTLVADLPLADHFNAGTVGYGLLTALWGLGRGGWVVGRCPPASTARPLSVEEMLDGCSVSGSASRPTRS